MSATRAEKLEIWNAACSSAIDMLAHTAVTTGLYMHKDTNRPNATEIAKVAAQMADAALTEWLARWGP